MFVCVVFFFFFGGGVVFVFDCFFFIYFPHFHLSEKIWRKKVTYLCVQPASGTTTSGRREWVRVGNVPSTAIPALVAPPSARARPDTTARFLTTSPGPARVSVCLSVCIRLSLPLCLHPSVCLSGPEVTLCDWQDVKIQGPTVCMCLSACLCVCLPVCVRLSVSLADVLYCSSWTQSSQSQVFNFYLSLGLWSVTEGL